MALSDREFVIDRAILEVLKDCGDYMLLEAHLEAELIPKVREMDTADSRGQKPERSQYDE